MIVVRVERWMDPEGLEVQEIGRMTLSAKGPEDDFGTYGYTLDEGAHPMGVRPLRDRGTVDYHARRQSVWSLVQAVLALARVRRLLQ